MFAFFIFAISIFLPLSLGIPFGLLKIYLKYLLQENPANETEGWTPGGVSVKTGHGSVYENTRRFGTRNSRRSALDLERYS